MGIACTPYCIPNGARTNAWHCQTCRLPLERQDCTGQHSATTQWQDHWSGPHAERILNAATCMTALRHHPCRSALPCHPDPGHRQLLHNRHAQCGHRSSRNGVAVICTSEPRDCGYTHADLLSAGRLQVLQTPLEHLCSTESFRTISGPCVGAKEGAGKNTQLGWMLDDSILLLCWQVLHFSMYRMYLVCV